jgi:outer membrane receptor for ferrienterochelin and colicin
MQRLRAPLVAVCAAACGVLLNGSVVRADERTDARREFKAGMQDVAEGKYDSGVERLQRAYDILPHPNVLYNIGLAHMYAGRNEAALDALERYKETAPPNDRVGLDSLIRSLRASTLQESEAAATAEGELAKGAEAGATEPPDTLRALETATAEVRSLAQQQNSEVLRRQAEELERGLAKLRSDEKLSGDPETTTKQAAAPQSKPPIDAQTRGGLYEEEVVSASRFAQSPLDAPNATAIITAQDIRMSGVTQLSALLRRVAGVEVTQAAPAHAEVSIRGLNRRSSNKVLMLLDGRPIRLDFNATSYWDVTPVGIEDVERIEIIRGPASALYGADAFSGVINVITRAPGTGGNFVLGRYGSNGTAQARFALSERKGALAYRLSAGHSISDNAVRVAGENRADVRPYTNTPGRAFAITNTNAEASYELAEGSTLSFGGGMLYGDSTLQGVSRVAQISFDNSHEALAHAEVTTPVGLRLGSWFSDVQANFGPSVVAPSSIGSAGSALTQRQAEVDLSWSDTLDLLVPQTLTIGATYRFKYITWNWLDDNHTQHHAGGYLQDVIQLAEPLKLQIGARVDNHPLLPKVQFSPRGSLVYRFLREQSLRVSAGRAFRSPSFIESYLQNVVDTPLRGVAAWGRGNSDLNPESITSVELGYQNQASDYFSLEANAYYNWIKDAILITQNTQYSLSDYADENPLSKLDPETSAFPVSELRYDNERATYRQMGGELGARVYPVRGLDVYANYSIHMTEPIAKTKVDPARASEQQTSLHKVNAGVQYRAPFGLELSADVSWMGEQLWIEQVTDVERGGVRWQEYQVPSLVLVNARIGYMLFADRLELGVAGTNLAFQHKRQHPFGQPLDTRVLGTAKVRF